MNFRIQIKNKIPTTSYASNNDLVLHGVDQGSRNEGTHWIFISVLMLKLIKEISLRCKI